MTPEVRTENFISGTLQDLVSIQSSLNMEPSPITDPQGTYLSDVDEWAQHAEEHLITIITNLRYAQSIKESAMKLLSEGHTYDAIQLFIKL